MTYNATVLVLLSALLFILLLKALFKSLVQSVTVLEYQRALFYRSGRLKQVLEPGNYIIFRPLSTLTVIDLRSRVVTVPNQEVLTADNIAVRSSLAASYRVLDPVRAVQDSVNYQESLYLALQLALRELTSGVTAEELLAKRNELSQALFERSRPQAEALGLELQTAGIRDITFPGELKKVFAQVVQAEKAAQAALTKARAETASMRSLANAARMAEGNPALLTLRTLQSLSELANSTGNTLVVGLPSPTLPVLVQGEKPPSPPVENSEIDTQ